MCPLDDGELQVLARLVLPPRLDGVRVLYLGDMRKLTDAGLQALAAAGCGKQLTSLILWGECLCFYGFPSLLSSKEHRSAQG